MSLTIQVWDIDKIIPYELNAKKHDQKQIEKIAKSIETFGFDQPIVVDKNGVIIKGHGRRLACLHLKFKKVPVLVRNDLTDEQIRASRLVDNRVAISDIDTKILQQELATLDIDLLKDSFDIKELDFVAKHDLAEINLDAFASVSEKPAVGEETENNENSEQNEIERVDNQMVKIERIFGFKEVAAKDAKSIYAFIALAEEITEKTGAEAVLKMFEQVIKENEN